MRKTATAVSLQSKSPPAPTIIATNATKIKYSTPPHFNVFAKKMNTESTDFVLNVPKDIAMILSPSGAKVLTPADPINIWLMEYVNVNLDLWLFKTFVSVVQSTSNITLNMMLVDAVQDFRLSVDHAYWLTAR
jgi:hypothetical protein